MQHYTVYLFLEDCSTYFGWYLHSSSGAYTNLFKVSDTCQTVTATCCYCGRAETECGVGNLLVCFGVVADSNHIKTEQYSM